MSAFKRKSEFFEKSQQSRFDQENQINQADRKISTTDTSRRNTVNLEKSVSGTNFTTKRSFLENSQSERTDLTLNSLKIKKF